MQYAPRSAPQIFALYCKTRNFVAQFAQINWALFQNVKKKKIRVRKLFSRVGFERPLKTASSELRKFKTGQCLLESLSNFKHSQEKTLPTSASVVCASQMFHIENDQTPCVMYVRETIRIYNFQVGKLHHV